MAGMRRHGLFQRAAATATTILVLAPGPAAVASPPKTPTFGRAIDAFGGYVGARRCDPDPEPGVLAFRRMVLGAYPGTGAGGIGRACYGSASSEHHEGRAWDWGVNAGIPSQKKKADQLIGWLTKDDTYGNEAAMARRTGVMYIIWNRRIWFPGHGWEVYCRPRGNSCVDPDGGGVRSPHRDHVHFSFTWPGARKRTTFWHRDRSMVAGIESRPGTDGYWLSGRNGSVMAHAAPYYGSKEIAFLNEPFVSVAAPAESTGYWIVTTKGRVFAFGDLRRRGDIHKKKARAVDLEATTTGVGYWIVTPKGRVFAFGNAGHFGDARADDLAVVAMTPTPSSQGYWLLTRGGRALPYGDATDEGSLDPGSGLPVDIAATPSGQGYWIALKNGRVRAFGDAAHFGDAGDRSLASPIVGLAPTSSGQGYRLVTKLGNVLSFGDAG